MSLFKNKKELSINISIVITSVIAAIVIAEIALRVIVPLEIGPQIIHDDILLYRSIGGRDKDADGWRNIDVLEQADLVVIGDSQTESLNALRQDAWPQVLGRLSSSSVYQMAFGGYGAVQYAYLFDRALDLNPKTVVIGLYMGNDLYDAYRAVYTLDQWKEMRNPEVIYKDDTDTLFHKKQISPKTRHESGSFKMKFVNTKLWIHDHSRVYKVLCNSTRSFRKKIGIAETPEQKMEQIKTFADSRPDLVLVYDDEPELATVMRPKYRLIAVDLEGAPAREGLRITKELLSRMNKTAKESKITFLVAIIPTKEFVYHKYSEESGKALSNELSLVVDKETAVMEDILQYCEESDIECISTASSLVDALKEGIRIYPLSINGHPVTEGYRRIAAHVHKHLLDITPAQDDVR